MEDRNIFRSSGIGKLLATSSRCFPDRSLPHLKLRTRMVLNGMRHRDLVGQFLSPPPGTALQDIMQSRPEILGALVWPYQCSAWNPRERLSRILSHYSETDRLPGYLRFPADRKLILHDLKHLHEGLRIVLDQPRWFMREGGLALNLFTGDFRAFSLAFSLHRGESGGLEAFIGCVQGRNVDGVLDTYRELTKAFFGLRPRDLLFEYFRVLCDHMGVVRIYAIADAYRHHRHPYFSKSTYPTNYDDIWKDRGGTRVNEHWFAMPLSSVRRDMSEIKPNKRSLYRKRYAFLDDLQAAAEASIPNGAISCFTDT